jgi:diguanylate cyclase
MSENRNPSDNTGETVFPLLDSRKLAPTTAIELSEEPENIDPLVQMRLLLRLLLENALVTQPELEDEVRLLLTQVRDSSDIEFQNILLKQLHQFWLRINKRSGDQVKTQEGLVRLLRALVNNVGEMVEDDKWLHGQIAVLRTIVSNPLNKHSIADAERTLHDTVIKQQTLKQSLTDARTSLKSMMAAFIERMDEMTASTGEYHGKIAEYSDRIGKTDNMTELSHILKNVMHDTSAIQASTLHTHDELLSNKKHADDADARVKKLEVELEQVSELVREDQLTGALNRRGLDETVDREIKRAARGKTALSIAMLDIDNFKLLNDRLGHQAGDHALTHLIKVVKETLRPSDSVGRYGGEEFIIIMPNTYRDDGVAAIQRLQRNLTKNLFLHNNDRILVTFSAGVALHGANEEVEEIISRADKAMYKAKKGGKNRVEAAD